MFSSAKYFLNVVIQQITEVFVDVWEQFPVFLKRMLCQLIASNYQSCVSVSTVPVVKQASS